MKYEQLRRKYRSFISFVSIPDSMLGWFPLVLNIHLTRSSTSSINQLEIFLNTPNNFFFFGLKFYLKHEYEFTTKCIWWDIWTWQIMSLVDISCDKRVSNECIRRRLLNKQNIRLVAREHTFQIDFASKLHIYYVLAWKLPTVSGGGGHYCILNFYGKCTILAEKNKKFFVVVIALRGQSTRLK